MDTKKIGEYIKSLRLKNNLTQEELASKVYVTNKAISRWETGKSIPEIDTLYFLSKEFNVSVNDILEAGSKKKDEVKSYYKKRKIIEIILLIIIFILPIISIIELGIMAPILTAVDIYSHGYTSEAIDNTVWQYIITIIMGNFLIPWFLLLITYIASKLNKEFIFKIVSIICMVICLLSFIFKDTFIISSYGILPEILILIINIVILIILNKDKKK